jgi:putative acetyltransferase
MTALIATAHSVGIPKIKLIVLSDNQRAIALYRRFGFCIEIRDDAYLQRDGATLAAFTMARITRQG